MTGSPLGTRREPTRLRLLLILVLGFLIALVLTAIGAFGGGTAKADECTSWAAGWVQTHRDCTEDLDDVISPDTRQAISLADEHEGTGSP